MPKGSSMTSPLLWGADVLLGSAKCVAKNASENQRNDKADCGDGFCLFLQEAKHESVTLEVGNTLHIGTVTTGLSSRAA